MSYPFELEHVESGLLNMANRTASGLPLYTRPSLTFTPLGYTPLYYYLSGLAVRMFSLGYLPLRSLSFLSFLATALLIGLFIRKETGDAFAAWAGAGFHFALCEVGGMWYDLARVDSLFVLLLLSSLFALKRGRRAVGGLLPAVLLAAAFLTKQTALLFFPLFAIAAFLMDRKRTVFFSIAFAVALGTLVLFCHVATDGWFTFYVFRLQLHRPVYPAKLLHYLLEHRTHLAVPSLLFGALIYTLAHDTRKRADAWFYAIAGVGSACVCLSALAQLGGFVNNMLPLLALLSTTSGLAVASLRRYWHGRPVCLCAVYVLVVLGLLSLRFAPRTYIPDAEDLEAGQRAVRIVKAARTNVWVASHQSLAVASGLPLYADLQAVTDVLYSEDARVAGALHTEIMDAARSGRFGAIVLPRTRLRELQDLLLSIGYEKLPLIDSQSDAFMPVCGIERRPDRIFLKEHGTVVTPPEP